MKIICPTCGKEYEHNPSRPRKHCSRECFINPLGRFWAHVNKTDGCWLWVGALYPTGYGITSGFNGSRVPMRAHRLSWILAHGPIPPKTNVCHKCDNPKCVRPDHLFLGSARDNIRDALKKGRMGKKLRAASVMEILAAYKSGEPLEDIAHRHRISMQHVKNIASGLAWGVLHDSIK